MEKWDWGRQFKTLQLCNQRTNKSNNDLNFKKYWQGFKKLLSS